MSRCRHCSAGKPQLCIDHTTSPLVRFDWRKQASWQPIQEAKAPVDITPPPFSFTVSQQDRVGLQWEAARIRKPVTFSTWWLNWNQLAIFLHFNYIEYYKDHTHCYEQLCFKTKESPFKKKTLLLSYPTCQNKIVVFFFYSWIETIQNIWPSIEFLNPEPVTWNKQTQKPCDSLVVNQRAFSSHESLGTCTWISKPWI